MRIGIDIDDVITNTSESMKEYINKYDTEGEINSHIEEVMRGEMPTPAIKKFFENNSLKIFQNAKIKENASEVTKQLIENGNEIYLITSRGEIRFKGSEKFTLEYLKLNNIKYTKILFNSFEKSKICKENKIDLMVDDSVKYCMEIEKENIKSILFTSEVNKNVKTSTKRVNDWLELEKEINCIGDKNL